VEVMGLGIRLGLTGTAVSGGGGTPPDTTNPVLLIIAGQSNSRKAGNSAATPNAKYTSFLAAPNMFIGISNGSGGYTFAPYVPGTGGNSDSFNSGGAWGSELEFVYQMRQAGDNRAVYVVKQSLNGQNLAVQWAPTTPGANFALLEAKVASARAFFAANSITLGQEVICWNQGESDAGDETMATNYGTNFVAFLAAIRSRVSASALFIAERIRPLGHAAVGTDVNEPAGYLRSDRVREGTIAGCVADGNAVAIDTQFDPANFSILHPEEPWTEGIGLRCYAAWKGTYAGTYGALTDTTPDAFTFTDLTGALTSTVTSSSAILLSGFQRRAPISITGGEYRILNSLSGDAVVQDWGSASGFVENPFYKLQLRGTSSASNSTATSVTVTVGGVSDTWTITTEAAGVTLEAETTAFLAAVTSNGGGAMSGTQRTAFNALYIGLKADGLMTGTKLVRLYIGSLHDSVAGRIDLRDQSTIMVQAALGGSTDVPWSTAGWNPGGVSARGLNMQVNPATLNQNEAGLFAWLGSTTANANNDLGSVSTANLTLRVSSTLVRSKIHTGTNQSFSGTFAAGFYAAYRSTSTLTTLYGPAGTSLGTNATASATPAGTELWLGSPNSITADRAVRAHGVLGAGVTATDVLKLRNRLETFFGAFFA